MDPEDFKDQKNTEEEEKPKADQQKAQSEQEKPETEQQKPELDEEKPEADPVEVKKARNVTQFFKKSFSLIKLYPSGNP
ncbi:MAG: hypothetical protein E3J41_02615, partial [Candidatus Cloacimonadota bacterium]